MNNTHYISRNTNIQNSYDILRNTQIQTLNPEEFINFLSQLEDIWDMNTTDNTIVAFRLGYKIFFHANELNPDTGLPDRFDIDLVSTRHNRLKEKLGDMYHRAEVLQLLDNEDDKDITISMRINRLIDQVYDAWQIVFSVSKMNDRINSPTAII